MKTYNIINETQKETVGEHVIVDDFNNEALLPCTYTEDGASSFRYFIQLLRKDYPDSEFSVIEQGDFRYPVIDYGGNYAS